MQNMNNASDVVGNHSALLDSLLIELNEIRTANELVMQKNTDLWTHIVKCEGRTEYIAAALAEGKRIASEITHNAESRIENIMANAKSILAPQQEQIACIDREIAELTREMNSTLAETEAPASNLTETDALAEEFSQPGIEAADISKTDEETDQTEQGINSLRLALNREFSLREPQDEHVGGGVPEPTPAEPEQCEQQSVIIQEADECEFPTDDISNYNLAMSLVEQNENKIDLDVFIDLRYFTDTHSSIRRNMQKHSWQVKIEVEMRDNEHLFVGYGKVSTAVTSTLLRYDDVVLNDVFPFDIIEPNPENIAMYFYNCVEDTVSLVDLNLNEITIWEKQTLIMKVNSRNGEFDALLQKGDDLLETMRSKLVALEKEQPKMDPFLKSMLAKFRK